MSIVNRKAYHEYFILDEFIGGIMLMGSEVKSLRANGASFNDSFLYLKDGELYLKNLFIAKYKNSTYLNHEEIRERKILLTAKELRKIKNELKSTGITLIPLEIFEVRGRFKLKLSISKGKKLWNKKDSIKERDIMRETKKELNF